MRFRPGSLLPFLALAACGGIVEPPPDAREGAAGNGGSASGPSVSTSTQSAVAAACGRTPIVASSSTTAAAYASELVGEWFLCSGHISMLDLSGKALGVSFDADGSWYEVVARPEGGWGRATERAGTWEVNAGGGPQATFGVLLTFPDGKTGNLGNWLAACPRVMKVDVLGVEDAVFAGAGDVTCSAPPPLDAEALVVPAAACSAAPGKPLPITGAPALESALVGRWTLCSGQHVLGPQHDAVGLELRADGTFHSLYSAGPGLVVPGQGDGKEGTWVVVTSPDYPGFPGNAQVNFNFFGESGTYIIGAELDGCPRRLVATNEGVLDAVYATDDGTCAL
jgi:hypothetical protein